MQTVDQLRHLFEYDDWATRRTIVALRTGASERSLQILAHLLITKQEYFEKLYGKDSTGFDFWPQMNVDQCSELARATAENYERLLATFDDEGLGLIARYTTSEGIPQQNDFREMLTHILFHSSIHRGNIILKMREDGLEPPKIDYIVYLRETS
ncbi:MAG: DinB family protein [Acidobacteriota bacterium]